MTNEPNRYDSCRTAGSRSVLSTRWRAASSELADIASPLRRSASGGAAMPRSRKPNLDPGGRDAPVAVPPLGVRLVRTPRGDITFGRERHETQRRDRTSGPTNAADAPGRG